MTKHRIYSISVASVYPHYLAKAEKKGRSKAEVDEIICWLTGHSAESLDGELAQKTSFEDFFAQAPQMNPSRALITGVICGVRVENIEEPKSATWTSSSTNSRGERRWRRSSGNRPSPELPAIGTTPRRKR